MAATTTLELIQYYSNLLVSQYASKPKAVATIETSVTPIIMPGVTVETITFSPVPTGGTFVLTYAQDASSVTINWNDSAATIQTKLRGLAPAFISGGNATTVFGQILSGGNASTVSFSDIINGGDAFGWDLSHITVTGSIASGLLTVTFVGVQPPAALLTVVSSTLSNGSVSIIPVVAMVDLTMPLAVLNGFSLI